MSYPPGTPGGFPQPGVPDPNQPGFGQQPQYGQPPADPSGYAQPQGYPQPTSGVPGGYPPPGDINLAGAPAFGVEPPKKSRKGLVIGISAAVVLALGGGGAWAAASFFNEDGTDTEAKLPESAAAFASFNLDVSKSQQLELLELVEKFPDSEVNSKDPEKAVVEFIEGLADDEEDFAKGKFADWVGLSTSVALWEHKGEPYGLATVASTDDAKAKEGLKALQKDADKAEFGFKVSDGTATMAFGEKASQAAATAAVKEAEDKPLAESDKFAKAADFLGEGQVITAWADLEETFRIAEKQGGENESAMGNPFAGIDQLKESMTGQVAVGAKAEDFGVEVVYSTFGAKDVTKGKDGLMDKMAKLPDSEAAGAFALPEDLSKSLGVAAGGLLTGGLYGAGSTDPSNEMKPVFDALSGASGTVSVQGVNTSPQGQAVIETTAADKAETLRGMLGQSGGQFTATVEGNTITGQTSGYSGEGELSKNEYYADAVGGAPEAINFAVFADMTKLVPESEKKELGALKAIGAAFGTDGGESVGNIRLIIE